MKNHYIIKSNINEKKHVKNNEHGLFHIKNSIKKYIKSFIINSSRIKIDNPLILEKKNKGNKDEPKEQRENRKNKKRRADGIDIVKIRPNNCIHLSSKKIIKDDKYIKKDNNLDNKKTYNKNTISINCIKKYINKRNNTKNKFKKIMLYNSKPSDKNMKVFEDNINYHTLEISKTYNYNHNNYSTMNSLYKPTTKDNYIMHNFNNLYSTDNSSSVTKNTIIINKKDITKESSISKNNNNKSTLSDSNFKKINELNKNIDNKSSNKEIKVDTKKNNKVMFNAKEYYYKNIKKNNELIKQINSINEIYNIHNSDENINRKINKESVRSYSVKNKDKFYYKLFNNSRRQCNLKKRHNLNLIKKKESIFNNKINEKDTTSNIIIDNTNEANNKDMKKLIILIKSNWGNLFKVNFISITFIDNFNEKININKANYDINKQYIDNYNKGETKKLIFYYDKKRKIKNIEIINGFDDSGIKTLVIEDEDKEIIWRGNIPKKNLISSKPYIIILNNIKKFIKKKDKKKRNNSFDLESSLLFSQNVFSPYSHYSKKTYLNTIYQNTTNLKKTIKTKTNKNMISINDTYINKFNRNETYDKDNSEINIIQNIYSFNNISNREKENNYNSIETSRNKKIANIKSKFNNVDYQVCDKLKIQLISNYGNAKYIGLSGLEFYDDTDNIIDINENNCYVKINQIIKNNKQKQMINILFHGINNSTDKDDMLLTKYNDSFIEIDFKKKIRLKKIIIFNYNNDYFFPGCGTKKISLIFFKNNIIERTIKGIYINKNICEEGIEYGQVLTYPFNNCFGIKKYKNLSKEIKHDLLNSITVYNKKYDYYCPSYPSGFVVQLSLFNNYGSSEYIGLEQIKLFDEENNEIIMFLEDENNNMKDNNIPKIYSMPENRVLSPTVQPLILTKYININNYKNKKRENRIYIIFNNLIMLSKIHIINYYKYDEIAVKDIKIFIDNILIFEGKLKKENDIIFSNKLIKNQNSKNEEIHIEEERYCEKEFDNGTKVLSLI